MVGLIGMVLIVAMVIVGSVNCGIHGSVNGTSVNCGSITYGRVHRSIVNCDNNYHGSVTYL